MIHSSHKWNTGTTPVVTGFILSLALTLIAYFFVGQELFSPKVLTYLVMLLGGIQALVQLVFFLHLGVEERPRWNLMMFLFMLLIIIVIVCGSLWIMQNLNYNLMLHNGH